MRTPIRFFDLKTNYTTLMLFTGLAGSRSTTLRKKMAVLTDDRAKLMGEVIGAMRVIKMYAWEKPFAGLVHRLRKYVFKFF